MPGRDPGPRARSTCGRGRPRSTYPQRHADEGRHPRQANVSALRPIGDSGLRRNGGEVGASMARAPPPRTPNAIRGPARAPLAGEDARGPMADPEGAHLPTASCRRRQQAPLASTAGKRLRPAAYRGFRLVAGMTAKLAPNWPPDRFAPGDLERVRAGPDRFASGDVERVRAGPRIAFGVRGGGARSPYATSRTILPTCALVSMRAWALAASARG